MALEIVVQGPDARGAAADLAGDDRLVTATRVRTPLPDEKDPLVTLTVVVSILSASGGIAAVVECVLNWRERTRRRDLDTGRPLVVVVLAGDRRGRLEDLTPPELELLAAEGIDEDEDEDD